MGGRESVCVRSSWLARQVLNRTWGSEHIFYAHKLPNHRVPLPRRRVLWGHRYGVVVHDGGFPLGLNPRSTLFPGFPAGGLP